jgi:hypothetical protein
MGTIIVPNVYPIGVRPALYLRNGRYPSQVIGSKLAEYINVLSGRRMRPLFTYSALPIRWSGGSTSPSLRFYGRTTPSMLRIWCRMVMLPSDDTGSVNTHYVEWTATPTGGGDAIVLPKIYAEKRSTTTSNVPDEYSVVDQHWTTLAADTEYLFTMDRTEQARFVSCTIFEEQNLVMTINDSDVTADQVVSPSNFACGKEVYSEDIADLWETAESIWKTHGLVIGSWTCRDVSPQTVTNTSYKNIFNTSLSAWNAAGQGLYCTPEYANAYGDSTIAVKCNVYAATEDPGSENGYVKFVQNGQDVCEIDSIGAAGTYSGTGALGPASADSIQVLAKNTSSGKDIYVYAFSVYAYES